MTQPGFDFVHLPARPSVRFALALGALGLATGCPETKTTCDDGYARDDAGTCVRMGDAGADAAPGDAGDGGGGDVDAGPCGEVCSGATPLCDEGRGVCVGCLEDGDCTDDGLGRCETGSGVCVGCLEAADCTEAVAGRCDPAAQACAGCVADGDCAHLGATPACEEGSGVCVECTPDSEETTCPAPEERACDPVGFTCTGFMRGVVGTCSSCIADSECTGNGSGDRACVSIMYDGMARGRVCLETQANAPDGMCPRVYRSVLEAENTTGEVESYCFPRQSLTTCEAILGFLSDSCESDAECDPNGTTGAVCRNDGQGKTCTFGCTGNLDCREGFRCNTSASPSYCCTVPEADATVGSPCDAP